MNKLFASISTESSLSLEHHMERLALEANFLTNAIDNLKAIIPDLAGKLSGFINTFKADDNPNAMVLRKADTEIKGVKAGLGYASFATFDKTLVTVPEGFVGSFPTYIAALTACYREITVNAEEGIVQIQSDLSMFISNREVKTSIKDKTANYKKFGQRREAIEKELGKFFSDKHVRSKAYMSEIIPGFEEVDNLYKSVKELDNMVRSKDIQKIARMTEDLNNLLKMVIDDAATNPDSEVSGAAAKNISAGVYEAAKAVELVGIYRFRVDQMVGVVAELISMLHKVLKK